MILKGDIGTLEIEVLANKASGTNDFWEENWLYSTIKGNFPGFTANFDCNLRTDDFERFAQELRAMVSMKSDVAKFTTMEEGLTLLLEREHTGTVKVTGKMTATELTQCSLEFKYQVDNPTLERFIYEVEDVIKTYPIIGTP
jgi:hypothetical protein